jgi:hypothetical protein
LAFLWAMLCPNLTVSNRVKSTYLNQLPPFSWLFLWAIL